MALIADDPYWSGNLNNSILTQIDLTNLVNASGSAFYAQVDWSKTETFNNSPNPPVYDWTLMTSVVSLLQSNNLRPCLVLQGAPDWHKATIAGSGSSRTFIVPADASAFITAVINQFPGVFKYIIIGNEEYSGYNPSNGLKDPAIGSALLAAVSPTIRSLDSTIQIGMFPLLNGQSQAEIDAWWNIFFTGTSPQFGSVTPLVNYVDFPTLHYYSGTNDPNVTDPKGLTLSSWLTSYKNARSTYGSGSNKKMKMKITEYGWTASNNPQPGQVTNDQQATFLQHLLDTARTSTVVSHASYFNFGGLFGNKGQNPRPAYNPTLTQYVVNYPQWTPPPGIGEFNIFQCHR